MNEPPKHGNLAVSERRQLLARTITDSDLRAAAYRQAMALYDSCVRLAATGRSQREWPTVRRSS